MDPEIEASSVLVNLDYLAHWVLELPSWSFKMDLTSLHIDLVDQYAELLYTSYVVGFMVLIPWHGKC